MPKYTLIIPAYNMEKQLPGCLGSVAAQTYRDFEVLVVDDGSTDRTAEAAEGFSGKLPSLHVIRQENKGLGGARNTGIENAAGEYLWFIDADDRIVPDALERIDGMLSDTGAHAAVFDAAHVSEDGAVLKTEAGYAHFGADQHPSGGAPAVFTLAESPAFLFAPVLACNKVFRRDLYLSQGIRFPEHAYYEDLATVPKLCPFAGKIAYLPAPLYEYVQRQDSIMHRGGDHEKRCRDLTAALAGVDAFYRQAGLSSAYGEALDFLTVFHALYLQTVRMVKTDAPRAVLLYLHQYVREQVPDLHASPYLVTLSAAQRAVLELIDKKQYLALKIAFSLKK